MVNLLICMVYPTEAPGFRKNIKNNGGYVCSYEQ